MDFNPSQLKRKATNDDNLKPAVLKRETTDDYIHQGNDYVSHNDDSAKRTKKEDAKEKCEKVRINDKGKTKLVDPDFNNIVISEPKAMQGSGVESAFVKYMHNGNLNMLTMQSPEMTVSGNLYVNGGIDASEATQGTYNFNFVYDDTKEHCEMNTHERFIRSLQNVDEAILRVILKKRKDWYRSGRFGKMSDDEIKSAFKPIVRDTDYEGFTHQIRMKFCDKRTKEILGANDEMLSINQLTNGMKVLCIFKHNCIIFNPVGAIYNSIICLRLKVLEENISGNAGDDLSFL